jgi:RNA-directed DNA polymerase
VNKQGLVHPNFLPAISRASKKAINQEIRSWHIQIKNDKSLLDLSTMFNPVLRGWFNYYGRFYPSAMKPLWRQMNWYLGQWVQRKYKRFAGHKRRAFAYLNTLASANTHLFIHWKLGTFPGSKVVGAG